MVHEQTLGRRVRRARITATLLVLAITALFICPVAAQTSDCLASGDVDGNGIPLTVADYVFLVRIVHGIGSPPPVLYEGDLNADGYLDGGDLEKFGCVFISGMSCFVPYYPVPVPCVTDTTRGACRLGDSCSVRSPANCATLGGVYTPGGHWCCECGVWGDLNSDNAVNPVDVAVIVTLVYRGVDNRNVSLPFCPGNPGDVNCDGMINPVDVVQYVAAVYRQAGGFSCIPCEP